MSAIADRRERAYITDKRTEKATGSSDLDIEALTKS